ncbi:MAG: hypothetical protein FJ146_05255 [Deltaproteobacteria bacterium]|nr:hypothetical protein [Deltaproteobacteria bacterium]
MASEHNFKRFIKESGFKVLALARLSQCEYSVVFYLLNCAASGLDQFITTEAELASLIGYDDATLRTTLSELATKHIIKIHYGDLNANGDSTSASVGLQYDVSKWVLTYDVQATSHDAIVFPFRRTGSAALQVLEGQKRDPRSSKRAEGEGNHTWQRVIESFIQNRSLDDDELEQVEAAAKILVEVHPVDQVLLMLRHFNLRIPTLSLLASSWQHYQEIFESETQKVDMLGARQKHQELDQKLRDQGEALLAEAQSALTEEERTVLQILVKHRHPRRQLFWAYQLRSRYPNLASFFADNASLMLPVTTGGAVVKRHD